MLVRFSWGMCLFLSCALLQPVCSAQSSICDLILEIDKERAMCHAQTEDNTTGCNITWDKFTCWPTADIGEVVTIPCPKYLFYFTNNASPRNLSKTCTVHGWPSSSLDSYIMDCGYNPNNTVEENSGEFYTTIKAGYTVGHSISLISLMVAITILCLFRKLHCTRNYIHMHLFVSLILKAVTVFIKDVVLYEVGETENCQSSVSTLSSRRSVLLNAVLIYCCRAYIIRQRQLPGKHCRTSELRYQTLKKLNITLQTKRTPNKRRQTKQPCPRSTQIRPNGLR